MPHLQDHTSRCYIGFEKLAELSFRQVWEILAADREGETEFQQVYTAAGVAGYLCEGCPVYSNQNCTIDWIILSELNSLKPRYKDFELHSTVL